PDAADAEHYDRIAEADLERLDHPARPGHHAAAERPELLERQVLVHLHCRALGHDRVAGEARLAEEVRVHRSAVQRRRTVEPFAAEAQRYGKIAISRPVGAAARALAARVSGEDHVIAHREAAHTLAQRLDHP